MTGMAERSADSGSGSTPRNGAESMATDAVPRPWPASCWVSRPPKECPMIAGLCRSAAMASAMWLVTCPTLLPAKTCGLAPASSTVAGAAGPPGGVGVEAVPLDDRPPGLPARGEHPQAVDEHNGRQAGGVGPVDVARLAGAEAH